MKSFISRLSSSPTETGHGHVEASSSNNTPRKNLQPSSSTLSNTVIIQPVPVSFPHQISCHS